MQLRSTSLSHSRVLATAVAITGAVTWAWAGESIQFSKPAVEIAIQKKEQQRDLPEPRSKQLDFSGSQQMERPAIQQPSVVQVPARERDEDDDAGRHPLLRDPNKFPDAVGRADARNALALGKTSPNSVALAKTSPTSTETRALGSKRTEPQHALSPITDLNWDSRERERERRRQDSLLEDRSSASDRSDARKRDPYASRENAPEQNDSFTSAALFDPSIARPRENPIAAQLERHAAFDQLFNPNAGMVRSPGSLEPVTGLDVAKPAVPVAMPMLGNTMFDKGAAVPIDAFKAQQERLRAPSLQDVNKKDSSKITAASANAIDPHFQTPLMRQPTVHDIPARKF
jgi:hypothetical protein